MQAFMDPWDAAQTRNSHETCRRGRSLRLRFCIPELEAPATFWEVYFPFKLRFSGVPFATNLMIFFDLVSFDVVVNKNPIWIHFHTHSDKFVRGTT